MSSTPPSEQTAPRNIGTQCEKNYFIGSRSESKRVRKLCERLWLKENLKKYLRLGVQVTDPLLNVAKWIAYVTEVSVEMLLIFTKYKIFPSKIGATVMVTTPLLL